MDSCNNIQNTIPTILAITIPTITAINIDFLQQKKVLTKGSIDIKGYVLTGHRMKELIGGGKTGGKYASTGGGIRTDGHNNRHNTIPTIPDIYI